MFVNLISQKYKLLLIVAVGVMNTSMLHARSCSDFEKDKAEYFAEKAGRKIAAKYEGSKNLRTNLNSCKYNSYSDKYTLDISVYWDGSIFSSNHYNIDGILKLNSDGSNTDFSQTYANENVKDLGFMYGAAFALGALAAASTSDTSGTTANTYSAYNASSTSTKAYNLKFTNNCRQPVNLLIHFKNANGSWETRGWWEFSPYESDYLASYDDKKLRTTNSVLYYYAETKDGNKKWDGYKKVERGGKTYYMDKIVDDSGDTTWSVSCD